MIKGALFSVELISAESGCLRAKGSWERVPGSQGEKNTWRVLPWRALPHNPHFLEAKFSPSEYVPGEHSPMTLTF